MKVYGEYLATKQNSPNLCHVIDNKSNIQFSSCLAKSDSMSVVLVKCSLVLFSGNGIDKQQAFTFQDILWFGRRKFIARFVVHCSYEGLQLYFVFLRIMYRFKMHVRFNHVVSSSGHLAHCPRRLLPLLPSHRKK